MTTRPGQATKVVHLLALVAAAGVAIATAGSATWDLQLALTLLAFSVVSDFMAVAVKSLRVQVSGSFSALVLAMAFLGGAPAALIGVLTIGISALRWRTALDTLLNNLVAYAWFPLAGGLSAQFLHERGLVPETPYFYLAVLGIFAVALLVNGLIVIGYEAYLRREALLPTLREIMVPHLPAELATALLVVAVAYLYEQIGLGAMALFAVVLFTYQHLMGRLVVSEERAEALERRTQQLASLQVGLLSTLLRTLDVRDRMTARHSAAVARYSREIAAAAGHSEAEQDLVHTAGLLHDIGKFIFPDRILKGGVPLTEEDWRIVAMHPYQGAKLVSEIEAYGPVSDIILAHHERPDGRGYPRGLAGDEIPALSRIISVADVYDVLTARDSYREPVSSFEAIKELRRAAGTQLDARYVEIFVELLGGRDLRYRHGEDADFDAELALGKRIDEHALPREAAELLVGEPAG